MDKIVIDNDAKQNFRVPFEDDYIKIELDFRIDNWFMNLEYKSKSINGIKLSSEVKNSAIFLIS